MILALVVDRGCDSRGALVYKVRKRRKSPPPKPGKDALLSMTVLKMRNVQRDLKLEGLIPISRGSARVWPGCSLQQRPCHSLGRMCTQRASCPCASVCAWPGARRKALLAKAGATAKEEIACERNSLSIPRSNPLSRGNRLLQHGATIAMGKDCAMSKYYEHDFQLFSR